MRLTGGEPLLYPPLLSLVRRLALFDDPVEITLTTIGQALSHLTAPLRKAGLSRINVSQDTLNPKCFSEL
ncbi:MAG: hypothetical protein DHS20C16_20400 [Phycisphaerae bacterium]|nr:MAG: hypothetical protein DHS20C16_20400 [Phycisphaerae bacterium]